MERLLQKNKRLRRRIQRVRYAIRSRQPRPRLVINCTNRYLWAQIVDDEKRITLCSASTGEKDFTGNKKNKEAATRLGQKMAQVAQEAGVKEVVFDRRGKLYHGRVKAFAEAARENGLEF